MNNLMMEEEIKSDERPPEKITVYYPEQAFSPAPYETLRYGGLYYSTTTGEHETVEDAYARARVILQEQVDLQFAMIKADWRNKWIEVHKPGRAKS